MLCSRCHHRLAPPLRRLFSTRPATLHPQATTSPSTTNPRPAASASPAATSTAAAQPFTAGHSPSPSPSTPPFASAASTPVPRRPAAPRRRPPPASSTPAGTLLRGINFLKDRNDPVALADDEYPAWLWDVLKRPGEGAASGKGDAFAKSKKERRLATKAQLRREARGEAPEEAPVPVTEQTVDLPHTLEAREELTRAMRVQRRKAIRERNFLGSST